MGIAPDGTTVLTSRNGNDFTAEFPTLTGVLTDGLDGEAALLDGEIVVYDEHGRPDFGLLQQRRGRHTRRGPDRSEPVDDVDLRFLAFDILRLGDTDLLAEPYDTRHRILTALPMPDPHKVSIVPAFTIDELAADRRTPHDLLDQAAATGHEGLVAKVRSSVYLPGKRSDTWKKHPLIRTQEVIICGWRPWQRGFAGTLGGLLLGGHDPDTGDLVYLGDVGPVDVASPRGPTALSDFTRVGERRSTRRKSGINGRRRNHAKRSTGPGLAGSDPFEADDRAEGINDLADPAGVVDAQRPVVVYAPGGQQPVANGVDVVDGQVDDRESAASRIARVVERVEAYSTPPTFSQA
jgi:hypothetical protein